MFSQLIPIPASLIHCCRQRFTSRDFSHTEQKTTLDVCLLTSETSFACGMTFKGSEIALNDSNLQFHLFLFKLKFFAVNYTKRKPQPQLRLFLFTPQHPPPR